MAVFRRSRRSAPRRASGAPRRQVELQLISYGGEHNGASLKAVDWLLYPSDLQYPSPGASTGTPTGIITVPNMTLIKTRVNFFAQTGTIPTSTWASIAVGILEWESKRTSPLPNTSDVPSPFFDSADWIWQLEVPFTKAPASQTQAASLVDPLQIHSRAMRRLPSGSGILIVSEYVQFGGVSIQIMFNAAIQLWFKMPK